MCGVGGKQIHTHRKRTLTVFQNVENNNRKRRKNTVKTLQTDYDKLAELLLPDIHKAPEDWERQYPERNLPKGAQVTRLAPSPTGFIHLGNLFGALTDERVAHQSGGVFYLRIEDTDAKREVEGAVETVIDVLRYFGIEFDEGAGAEQASYGPYFQRQRAEIYQTYAKDLIRKGKAYPCFCTEEELNEIKDKSKTEGNPALWNEVEGKAEKYYIPVLKAFMEELSKINAENENIPEKMIRYLLGRYDFYKVITDDRNKTTRVEAINIAGTLNQSSGSVKSIAKIPVLKMPTQFYHIGFKPGSDNTIEVVCDEGWQISMRIHSASSRIEPSLKFDVNLISLPSSVHTQIEPWENDPDMAQRCRLGVYAKKLIAGDEVR